MHKQSGAHAGNAKSPPMRARHTTWGRVMGWAVLPFVAAAAPAHGIAVVGNGAELGAAFDAASLDRYVIITEHMDLTMPESCSTWFGDGCASILRRFDVPPEVHAIVVCVNPCSHLLPTLCRAVCTDTYSIPKNRLLQ